MVDYGIRIHKDNHCWESSELRKSCGTDGGFASTKMGASPGSGEVEYLKVPRSIPDPGWNPDCFGDVTFHRALRTAIKDVVSIESLAVAVISIRSSGHDQ